MNDDKEEFLNRLKLEYEVKNQRVSKYYNPHSQLCLYQRYIWEQSKAQGQTNCYCCFFKDYNEI